MSLAEQQPLLQPIPEEYEDGIKHTEVILGFEPAGDGENPKEWPVTFKWSIVLLLACMAFTVTFTCISVVPVASSIVADLSHNPRPNPSSSALLVTIWELGEAAGPLLIAPLSEIYGRYPVLNICNVLFILATVLAALSPTTTLFITARVLTGLSVASNVLNPAVIGDMFESEQRGSAMSLIMLAPLIGGAVGPAISGAIAQTLGWRTVLLLAAGLAGCCEVLFLTCFKETYKMSILRRKARVATDHHTSSKLWHAITRPAAVLFSSGVLLALSLYGSVAFSYFYVMSTTLPGILLDVYGFSPAMTGLAFINFSIGSFLAVFLCNATLDRIYIALRNHRAPTKSSTSTSFPEYRLPMSILGAFTLPLSVTAYGWIAQLRLPVPLLLFSVALLGFTLLLAFIPLSAYVVDACGLYSASAMTGIIVTRCLMGTFLPLATAPLAEHFGYGWGFTWLGLLSLSLAPIPVAVFRYGEKWRQRCEFTREQ